MVTIPRLVVAAPASGSGKTSIATGLLSALRARGLTVSPHKVGPDYIDPGYHGLAAGRPGRNLDPWLVGEERVVGLFRHGATTPTPADVAVVEGVMGLFDGAAGREDFASTAHVARLLAAPVVLVVDGRGMARSVAALVHGYATWDPRLRLAGVILNRVGSARHEALLTEAVAATGVPVLGAVARRAELATPSRHLGLVPAAERAEEAERTVAALGAVVSESIDLAAVLALARSAPDLPPEGKPLPLLSGPPAADRVRVAVAGGAAFTFDYAEQAELLAGAGAEVVTFDPLLDEALPADVDGLVVGGGFPEAYAEGLSRNAPMRAAVAAVARDGVPVAAECAGLLYLGAELDGQPMCGVLGTRARMTERLTLGYREAVAPVDSVLATAGTRVRGHEFHRTQCLPGAGAAAAAWQWRHEGATVTEGFVGAGVHASYLHLHWAGVPGIADRFVAACRAARERR